MIRSTFAIPALVAIASAAGLVIALAGEGGGDAIGCAMLAVPLLATGWAVRRAAPRARS